MVTYEDLKKIIEETIDKKLSSFRPTASPSPPSQAPPYPWPQPPSFGAQLEDMVKAITAMKAMGGQSDLKATLELIKELKQVPELLGQEVAEDPDAGDRQLAMKFLDTIASRKEQPQPQRMATTQGPQFVNMPEKTPVPYQAPEEEINLDEEPLSDEELKAMIEQIPESYARKVLDGLIPKAAIMGYAKLQGLLLSDEEYDRGMKFLKEKWQPSPTLQPTLTTKTEQSVTDSVVTKEEKPKVLKKPKSNQQQQ